MKGVGLYRDCTNPVNIVLAYIKRKVESEMGYNKIFNCHFLVYILVLSSANSNISIGYQLQSVFKERTCCGGTTWRTYGNADLTQVLVFKGDTDDLGFDVLPNPGVDLRTPYLKPELLGAQDSCYSPLVSSSLLLLLHGFYYC